MDQREKIARLTCTGSAEEENQRISELLAAPFDKIYQLQWKYDQTTVALGRSQKVSSDMLKRADKHGISVYQRLSGGGAVLTSPNLFSLTTLIPVGHPLASLDLVNCFRITGKCWHRALLQTGIESVVCEIVDKGPSNLQWICFAGASHGELFDNKGNKLLGLAQVRKRHGVAVMAGMYNNPVEWESLFDVYKGAIPPEELDAIKNMTTCARTNGTNLSPAIKNTLINHFSQQLLSAV